MCDVKSNDRAACEPSLRSVQKHGPPLLRRSAGICVSPTAMLQARLSALAVGIGAGVMAERWSQRRRDCSLTRCSRLPPGDHSGPTRCTGGVRASQRHRLSDPMLSASQVAADSLAVGSAFVCGCWQPWRARVLHATALDWVPLPPLPAASSYFWDIGSGNLVAVNAPGMPSANGARLAARSVRLCPRRQ